MAVESTAAVASKDMRNEDLQELSNIFASEFNSRELHDRVLCFQIIDATEFKRKDDSDVGDESQSENEAGSASLISSPAQARERGLRKRSLPHSWSEHGSNATASPVKSARICTRSLSSSSLKGLSREWCSTPKPSKVSATTPPTLRPKHSSMTVTTSLMKYRIDSQIKQNSDAKETIEQNEDGEEPRDVIGDEQKVQYEAEERQETTTEYQNKEIESSCKDAESKTNENENKSIVSKLFVHSQWLAVQSSYFKALFYSGMKETYSKDVVMKIYEHELEAHQTLIEAMYKLDALSDKDYRLVVQVLVLAHKYDVRHLIKKCKYALLSTTPSLEMCEYILGEIKHLSDTADIYDMLEKFLVKEFTPIDKTWTLEKFTSLSEAALRLLLRSDNLNTRSENTIFVALMKWVRWNVSWLARKKCDLLDLVRFEFMSMDFLYDVVQGHIVASLMPGFQKYLLNGLAYYGFSEIRRKQLEPKPKKRPFVADAAPTFSWVIDKEVEEKLSKSPGTNVFSKKFWCKGYSIQLQLAYAEGSSKCSFYFAICDLARKACVYASCRAKSDLFSSRTIQISNSMFTTKESSWGYSSLKRNLYLRKDYTIDVWVVID